MTFFETLKTKIKLSQIYHQIYDTCTVLVHKSNSKAETI